MEVIVTNHQQLREIISTEVRKAFIEQKATAPAAPELPERPTRKQVAKYLGVSLPTIHEYMRSGKLKYSKVGRLTRFDRTDVMRLFHQQR